MNRPRARAALAALLAVLLASSCSAGDVLTRPGAATTSDVGPTTAPTTIVDATTETPPASDDPEDGVAGAAGVGDPYFPQLGNGGYDVARYDLGFTIGGGPDVEAVARVTATATEDLDTFDLDFRRYDIERVEVDGRPAAYRLDGEELVIDPEPVVRAGATFVVDVRYRGRPAPVAGAGFGDLGWQQIGGVTFVSDEPYGAHSWFPSNDHPSDKAAFGITITVPEGTTAVATGTLVSQTSSGGRTTTVWDHADPIPTYVVALAFGDLRIVESEGPHGVAIRHAFPPALADEATAAFADTADLVTDLEELFGPYPFDTYGVLVVDGELGYAMENQTLVLYPRSILDGSQFSAVTMVHELAHHWFGNWVSPASWDETWLNEGFAAYAEQLWLEHTTPGYDIDGAMRRIASRPHGRIGDPGVHRMFSEDVYQRGALTLHALRRTMGDAGFFRLLRLWCDRYGGSSATSEDFAALASEVAGEDLHPFFAQWLDAATTPPLPG